MYGAFDDDKAGVEYRLPGLKFAGGRWLDRYDVCPDDWDEFPCAKEFPPCLGGGAVNAGSMGVYAPASA